MHYSITKLSGCMMQFLSKPISAGRCLSCFLTWLYTNGKQAVISVVQRFAHFNAISGRFIKALCRAKSAFLNARMGHQPNYQLLIRGLCHQCVNLWYSRIFFWHTEHWMDMPFRVYETTLFMICILVAASLCTYSFAIRHNLCIIHSTLLCRTRGYYVWCSMMFMAIS